MSPHRTRVLTRRTAAHQAALRKANVAVASTVAVPRKPLLTNPQVRRFVRRELREGVPA